MLALVAVQACQLLGRRRSRCRGFRELVAFFDRVAPAEPIFYDGSSMEPSSFYPRADDEDFCRQIVRGDHLLYTCPLNRSIKPRDFVTSPPEVIEALRRRSGCRWLTIEDA